MSAHQVGVNDRALRAAAEKVTAIGYTGDAHRFVEGLVLSVLADGYRALEKSPPLVGTSSTKKGRAEARRLFLEARASGAGMVVEPIEPMPLCECGHHNDRHGLGAPCIKRLCSCPVYRPVVDA